MNGVMLLWVGKRRGDELEGKGNWDVIEGWLRTLRFSYNLPTYPILIIFSSVAESYSCYCVFG